MVINKVLLLCLGLAICMSGCSRQQSDWEKTRAANTTDAYEQFLKNYPSGEFSAQAQARVKELYEERDWQKARDADTLEAYQAFLKDHPEGKWTEEARIRVENFTLASAPPTVTPLQGAAPPASAAPAAPSPAAAAPAPKPATPPAAAAPPAATKPHPAANTSGSYGVQLGAFKTSADAANQRWAKLEKEYPKVLSDLKPKVAPLKSSSGTLYRLQVVNLTEKHATSICESLKSHSQGCFVLHP
ncbi:MAG TPA: SPOR domain-containing protein [Steroidobacteraceae bacterium]|jgi:cell division protein FtsN